MDLLYNEILIPLLVYGIYGVGCIGREDRLDQRRVRGHRKGLDLKRLIGENPEFEVFSFINGLRHHLERGLEDVNVYLFVAT